MISNTVIIFLRELLPIFIFYSFISALQFKYESLNHYFWPKLCALSLVVAICLYGFIELLSESFDGRGIEIVYSLAFIIIWLSLSAVLLLYKRIAQNKIRLLVTIGFVLLASFKSAEFFIYFGVFGQFQVHLLPIILGSVMGVGICVSFSLLYRFLLVECLCSRIYWIFSLLWFAFLAGQFSQIVGMLSQVDLLEQGLPVYTTLSIINDASEYGHLLNALVGYESSPSLTYILLYLFAFLLPLLIQVVLAKQSPALSIGVTQA